MKKLYILKIGGSVATKKSARRGAVRHALLKRVFREIKKFTDAHTDTRLIIIHGAGSFAHQLAKKYNLRQGTGAHKDGKRGALLTRLAMQKLNTEILEIAVNAGLPATSIHTGALFTQTNDSSTRADLTILERAIDAEYLPILYGEMVFDSKLGMTVCGGDRIVAYLAGRLPVEKIYFASDVDGIYTADPHVHKQAKLLRKVSLSRDMKKIVLSESHPIDVTGGLKGKIDSCKSLFKTAKTLREMHVFNGAKSVHFANVLKRRTFPHTIIKK